MSTTPISACGSNLEAEGHGATEGAEEASEVRVPCPYVSHAPYCLLGIKNREYLLVLEEVSALNRTSFGHNSVGISHVLDPARFH